MRLLKSVAQLVLITMAALLYVHQHVEMVKISYSIERKEAKIQEMLDWKGRVGYNIKNLETPARLEDALLAKKVDIVYPKRVQIYKASQPQHMPADQERLGKVGLENRFKISGILDFLGPRAEAHAGEK
jgi:hypothetical protein